MLQGLSYAKPYKVAIADYWNDKGQFPAREEWKSGALVSTEILDKSLIESIVVGEEVPGSISLLYTSRKDQKATADIEGKKIVLTPLANNAEITWKCTSTLPQELLPLACRWSVSDMIKLR